MLMSSSIWTPSPLTPVRDYNRCICTSKRHANGPSHSVMPRCTNVGMVPMHPWDHRKKFPGTNWDRLRLLRRGSQRDRFVPMHPRERSKTFPGTHWDRLISVRAQRWDYVPMHPRDQRITFPGPIETRWPWYARSPLSCGREHSTPDTTPRRSGGECGHRAGL